MLKLVITGGQTGADQAGWRAAKAARIFTGGAMPPGYRIENGNRPEFEAEFGRQLEGGDRVRTEANIRASDATLWFGDPKSPVGRATLELCRKLVKKCLVVPVEGPFVHPSEVAEWIHAHGIRVLNVAGNRESSARGIGLRVEKFLTRVFAITQREANPTR